VSATAVLEDRSLREEIDQLARARVFFAHRSVGAGLVDGIARLSRDALRVAEVTGELPEGVFGHATLGPNGDPVAKLRDLERMLAGGIGRAARVVLFKFCYADFDARTDATGVFQAYERAIGSLRAAYPRAAFVHVTVPLVSIERGGSAKAALRSLLGRTPTALADNGRREEFNDLLRRAYGRGQPMFDLALAESTTPSGRRELHELHGRTIAALAPQYTDDGGHLNAVANLAIARQLIAAIAPLAEAA
jgi:hypothetical protein